MGEAERDSELELVLRALEMPLHLYYTQVRRRARREASRRGPVITPRPVDSNFTRGTFPAKKKPRL